MRITAFLLPLGLVALPLWACSSDFNHAERNAAPEAQGRHIEFKPDDQDWILKQCIGIDAGEPLVDVNPKDGKLDDPICAHPDPGSRPVDCAAQMAGADFAWMWELPTDNLALATYTYDDNTSSLVAPNRRLGFEPPATDVPNAANLCSTPPPDGIIPFQKGVRFRGGPFTEYGGGFGQSFRTTGHNTEAHPSGYPGMMALEMHPSAEFPGFKTGAYDLSSWSGVAIWVRRGPLGMSTMRVGITERNSAEDLNSGAILTLKEADPNLDVTGIQEGKYCRRWRPCGCAAGTPCTLLPGQTVLKFCYDPAKGTPDLNDAYLTGLQACEEARCVQPNTSSAGLDPLFVEQDSMHNVLSSECTPYLQPDGHSDLFCWNPRTEPQFPPPAKRERCNNPYSRPITVGTDWQLVKVPFTELRQADEAKVSNEMDLKSVKQLVFTHGAGWTDFWVANIGFYRDH